MAVILPFLRASGPGDWSLAERARLSRLAERLRPEAEGVDVVFGASDTGEPWCVVTDPEGEVLIHVARIGGRFVVHDAAADVLQEGADLWALLLQILRAPEPEPASAEIVSFPLPSRHAQTLIALITAAAFLGETELLAYTVDPTGDLNPVSSSQTESDPPALDSEPPEAGPAPPPAPKSRLEAVFLADAPDRIMPPALHLASTIDGRETVETPAPALTSNPETVALVRIAAAVENAEQPSTNVSLPAPRLVVGSSSDDHLQGTAAAETLLGGEGDDTLDGGGAPEGALDRLVGGAGADVLILTERVLAEGGPGADRFVLPETGGPAGVVLDFRPGDADRFETADGRIATPLQADPVGDVLFDFRPVLASETPAEPIPGFRLSFDTDADGAADTTVLVVNAEWTQAPTPEVPLSPPPLPLEVFPGWPG